MAKRVQRRRGTTTEHGSFTGAVGEITVDLDKDTVVVHDGAQAGGFPLAREDMNNVTNRIGVQQLACNEGTNGQVLSTNGSGTLSFSSVDATTAVVGGDLSGTVGNAQIVANAVTSTELAGDAVTGAQLADNACNSEHYTDGSIDAVHIANDTITATQIAASTITSTQILDGTIVAGDIAPNAINESKILDGNVTTNKIANDAVTANQIANNAVTVDQINANAVTTIKIAANAVTEAEIVDGAVTANKIPHSTITSAHISADTIIAADVASDAIGLLELSATGVPDSTKFLRGDNSWATVVGVPSGVIALWSGATNAIPSGWVICNGSNSTPDLRDRFVVGAGSSYAVGATGGSTTTGAHTLTIAQMPAHTHSYTHKTGGPNGDDNAHQIGVLTNATTGSTGGGGSHTHANSLPPYYALAYIMKT